MPTKQPPPTPTHRPAAEQGSRAEPRIAINGVVLTDSQAMAVRVSVGNFAHCLVADGLGGDGHGERMTRLYLDRLSEVELLLHARRTTE